MPKKKVKNYIIHDTVGERPTTFTDGADLSIEEWIECVIEELMDDMGITYKEACEEFNYNFIVYELGNKVQVTVKTVVTIK